MELTGKERLEIVWQAKLVAGKIIIRAELITETAVKIRGRYKFFCAEGKLRIMCWIFKFL